MQAHLWPDIFAHRQNPTTVQKLCGLLVLGSQPVLVVVGRGDGGGGDKIRFKCGINDITQNIYCLTLKVRDGLPQSPLTNRPIIFRHERSCLCQ